MVELIYILMMTVSGFCWSLGGWGTIPKLWWQGKFWRRFVLPVAIIGLLCWAKHYLPIEYWQIGASGLTLCFVAHLGYGDGKSWFYRFAVGVSYILPAVWFGWTYWIALMPIVFIVTFFLSNLKATSKDFLWKIVEYIVGSVIIFTIIGAIQRPW